MALNWLEKQVAARENDNANIARENRRGNLMAAEQEALEKQGDAFAAARNRRLNSVMDIALRDPGRYAPSVHRAAVEWDRQNQAAGLRDHEMRMLRQQGENEFKVAEQKRFGMKEQGADAAGHNAEATKYGWDKQLEVEQERQKGLTEREKMIGERTERIAGMEHGTIGPDGKVTPGSRERVAKIGAETNAQQAELQRQHEIEKQKIISDGNVKAAGVAAAGRVGAAEARGEQAAEARRRRFDEMALSGKFVYAGIGADKWKNMSEDEREKIRKQFFGQIDELNGTGAAPVKKGMSDYESK